MSRLNIAIDGPAGAGKSTVAKRIAKELNIHYLDTGAMYRAMGLFVLRHGVDPRDEEGLHGLMPQADITVRYLEDGTQRVFIGSEDVTDQIRTPEISMAASTVSAFPPVRDQLSALQRQVGVDYDVVMDGRDITTNVLPHTKHKFFVTASPEVRAQRRCKELLEKGESTDFDAVLADIIRRDHQDTTRDYMPLRQAEDAMVVDTSEMTIAEVTKVMIDAILEKER
ncbi:MAG: (d)CMP kinase [Clostridia bacterium]|nr:(d)CMP kinase [Clostridia bacterium]